MELDRTDSPVRSQSPVMNPVILFPIGLSDSLFLNSKGVETDPGLKSEDYDSGLLVRTKFTTVLIFRSIEM